MKRLLSLLLPLVILPAAALSAQEADADLRLMTFNIRYGTADDGANAWPNRRALVADIITRHSPDVLAIQEALAFQLEELADVLDGYRKLGQHRGGGLDGEFSGLYVDESRLRIVRWGEFWLSPTPDVLGSRGWDAALTRMAVWADLEVLATGESVRAYGTHFDHRGETARLESARLIARHAEDASTAIVMGDLNAGEDSDPLRAFFDRGYESAYRELHPGEQTGTFNGFRDPSGGRRIDHILLSSGLEPRRAEIVDGQIDGAWPSDHFPVAAVVSTSGGTQTLVDAEALSGLGYRYIGPPGNRTIAVAGIPGDPLTYYVGAASGGIWKTTDGGTHWDPIFDDQPVSSIGALAVAPSDPNIIWVGTGETFLRSHISMGWGAFKSTDAGSSWRRVGLERTGRIGRVVIHPTDPDIVLVAALGHAQGPQEERGVYRTTDGGESWERVLFVNDSTGAIDIVMSPDDPNLLFAAMWQIEMKTWGRVSGGPGSSIWTSRDGGVTWTRLEGNGLPTRPFGKVGLAMTPDNPDRVYALIETGRGVPWRGEPTDDGALWRSDDRGGTWQLVNTDSDRLLTRPAYYTRMAVSPDDQDRAYFLTIFFSSTSDGGQTIDQRQSGGGPGFDNHDIWIDPTDGDRIIVGNDEGVGISLTRGRTWNRLKLPIAQIYRVTTDNRIPYTVCGNMQDGPSTCGPSNSKLGGGAITGGSQIPRGMWYSVGGGESGTATPDPVDPDIVWSTASGRGSAGGIVVRHDRRTGQSRDVEVWPVAPFGHAAADVRYRFIWDFPIAISPHDHNRVYVASQYLHVTTDGGDSWQVISPDLTLDDESKQVHSGGITPDNLGVEYGNTVYSIAESRLEPGLIWVGTNDGVVQVTRDGGVNWTNVTGDIPGMISWGTVSNIEPSKFDPGAAYIAVNGHQEGNFHPWVYRTKDYGASWELIVDGIQESPLSYARNVREDPVRPGLLYLATENAMYVSFDDGDRWQPL
ncbi:MAG: endonuclease/exonuclease/phosphatase family protein, partial [Gemmatimonadetes bacterium]|nr:endonuclease/exonuclease/phosphatase family protein [Gemmatimonadota bacterium]